MSIGIDLALGIGIAGAGRRAGWSIQAAATDIDFVNRRMASSGKRRSFDAFMAYSAGFGFSRNSPSYDQRLADPLVIDSYATDAARLRSDGLLIGPAATRLSTYPQTPQSWPGNGATLTNLAAVGQWSPVRVASGGQSWHSVGTAPGNLSVTSGTPLSLRFMYLTGTSGGVAINIYNAGAGTTSNVGGLVGALSAGGTAFGPISNIKNTSLGSGLYEVELTWVPNATIANARVYFGPNSATVGQYVDLYGGQITNTPYPREWILGTAGSTQVVAQDVLRWTPAQLGLVASQGALILRTTILGVDPSANGRLLEVGQADLTKGRISFLMQSNGYPSIVVTDETNTAVAFAQTAAAITAPTDITMSIAWGGGSCSMKLGSAALVTDASAASPAALTTFTLGSRADNSVPSFTRMRRLDVLAQRPSDADLAAIHDRIRLAA